MEVIDQPEKERTGDRLKAILEHNKELGYATFYILSAYVKTSGVERLHEAIQKFRETGGKVKAAVGIGQKNTSIQGLQSLIPLCDEAWIYHNRSSTSTFHPKVYAFEKPKEKAAVFVGSSNLTGGGLFTNYEVVFYSEYDLTDHDQDAKFGKVRQMLQFYSTPSEFCRKLTPGLITEIEKHLSDETKQTPQEREEAESAETPEPTLEKWFGFKKISPPPLPKSKTKEVIKFPEGPCDWALKGRLRWQKTLTDRDCQIVTSRSNATGVLSLTQARWEDTPGRKIEQTQYFRFDVFKDFIWNQASQGRTAETAQVRFCVKIAGVDMGLHRLSLRYNPGWESGERNYTTSLSWGELAKRVTDRRLVGRPVRIYDPHSGNKEPFYLEIA